MDIQSDIVVNSFVHQQASLHQLHHPHLSWFQKGFPHLHDVMHLMPIYKIIALYENLSSVKLKQQIINPL